MKNTDKMDTFYTRDDDRPKSSLVNKEDYYKSNRDGGQKQVQIREEHSYRKSDAPSNRISRSPKTENSFFAKLFGKMQMGCCAKR